MARRIGGIAVSLLIGCGGGGGVDMVAVFDEYAETFCAKSFECRDTFPGTATEFEDAYGADQAACVELYASRERAMALQASVDEGRVVYDEQDSQVCLDWMASIACDDLWAGTSPQPVECTTAWVGQVEDGGVCEIDDDCASAGSVCAGTCMPPPAG